MIREALILVRLMRYVSRRCGTVESKGHNSAAYHKAFHLLAKLLRGLFVGSVSPEKLKPLFDFLDKSGLAAKMDDSRFDTSKRPSQKGGGRGHGQWVTIHGTHIFVDNSGTVTKGPSKFVGLTVSETMSQPEISAAKSGRQSSAKSSAEGRNKPCTGFANKGAEKRHEKHWKEFGVTSNADYVTGANRLFTQPVGGDIVGNKRPDGTIVRYNMATGEYVAGKPSGVLNTYFKPKFLNGKVDLVQAYLYYEKDRKEKGEE